MVCKEWLHFFEFVIHIYDALYKCFICSPSFPNRGGAGVFSPVTCYASCFFAKKFGGMKKRLYFCAQHTHPASRRNSALRVSVFFIAGRDG